MIPKVCLMGIIAYQVETYDAENAGVHFEHFSGQKVMSFLS